MTSSRVNLRVPPRLIESARAAQYANRETFGARAAQDRMAKEVDRRVEAEQRDAPGRDPQRGGLLDFEKRRIPRPKLRNRWRPRWSVNTGFVYILSGQPPGSPYGTWRNRIWVAPGNGSQWTLVLDELNSTFGFAWLPLSDGMAILFAHVGFPPAQPPQTVVTGYKVTFDNVSEIVVPESVAMKFFKPAYDPGYSPLLTDFYNVNYLGSKFYGFGHTQAVGQAPFLSLDNRASSAVYDGLSLTVGEHLYAQDALSLYGSSIPVLGATRTSGLRSDVYLRTPDATDPALLGLATTFGIMDDLSLTSSQLPSGHAVPITPRTSPVVLSDTVERIPVSYSLPVEPTPSDIAPGGAVPGGLVNLLTTYDYHGGSYCQDRLADLGLAL